MNLKQKIKIGALAVDAYFSGSQAIHAQGLNKTKSKVVNVQKQFSEYWLNSTNGDRLRVVSTKKGVDIVDTAGNGFHVSPSGKVTFGETELDANDADAKLMNTVAAMATDQAFYKQRAGAIYNVENKKVTFDEKGNALILAAKGDKDLFAPMAAEKDTKTSQAFYENMKIQNPKLAEIAAQAIEGIPFTDLSREARKFVTPDHYTAAEKLQAYLPHNDLEM